MKLRVQHRTEYTYQQPVRTNSNEVRLQPVQSAWQQRHYHLLRILPAVRLRKFADFYLNGVHHFEVEEPHGRLLIEAISTVTTTDRYADGEPLGVRFEEMVPCREDELLAGFTSPSRYTRLNADIWKAAVDARDAGKDVFDAAKKIMNWVHSNCRYVPGVTNVNTTSEEFMTGREGVCQDFAHLMLAMCRSIGIPGRYISGYLFDSKRKELRGTHASHAWVELYLPDRGWYALDPTNNRLCDELYVTVAWGRDYEDAAPVKGSFFGSGSRQMQVTVHVEDL